MFHAINYFCSQTNVSQRQKFQYKKLIILLVTDTDADSETDADNIIKQNSYRYMIISYYYKLNLP